LGRGEDIAGRPDERFVEADDPRRRGVRGDGRPQLGPESGDEVNAADRRPRLPEAAIRATASNVWAAAARSNSR
jgi:hypothetical protein